MVRPIMEYASSVWDPHTCADINQLEAVQRSAAIMCYKDFSRFSSVSTMLTDLDLPTLQSRRKKLKLQMLYKIIHCLADIPDDCLTPVLSFLRSGYFNQLNTRVDSFKFSFFPSVIKLWNKLHQNIANAPTYTKFCNDLDTFIITPVHYNHT